MSEMLLERARQRLRRASVENCETICTAILQAIRVVAPFGQAAVMTTDPETMLPSGGIVEGFDASACQPFWEAEVADDDVNQFRNMVRERTYVASLAGAIPGRFDESRRHREVYASLDLIDELRVAFVSGSHCLGVGAFLRCGSGSVFSPEEMAAVQRLVEPVAELLRRGAMGLPAESGRTTPSVVLLDERGRIIGRTGEAKELLRDLCMEGFEAGGLSGSLQAALAHFDHESLGGRLSTRVRGRTGRWYRLHLASVEGQDVEGQDRVRALSIEPASNGDLLSILLHAYGLTQRETEVVAALYRGLSAKEIADEFSISPHTVRDHTKAIYEKVGVSSRGELLARLFSSHVLDGLHDAVVRVA